MSVNIDLIFVGEVIEGSEVQHNHAPDPIDIEVRTCVNKIKKAAKRGLETTSNVVKTNIGAVGLSFIPVCDVQFAYNVLLSSQYFVNNKDLLKDLLEYFENTYIGIEKGNGDRSEPMFPIKIWNSYDNVINDLPRTNNAIEGWHNAFSTRVGKYHNALNKFLHFLINEQNCMKLHELLLNQLGAGRDIVRRKKRNIMIMISV